MRFKRMLVRWDCLGCGDVKRPITLERDGRLIAPLIIGTMLLGTIPAVMAQALPAAVQACRTESDETKRLKCYDREVDRIQVALRPVSSATESNASPTQRRARTAGGPPSGFSARITTLSFRKGGEFVAALDNGQVWTQFVSEGKARIRVGDTVRIRPLLFGSFLLVGPSDWSTKVHQVPDEAP
jgi:hypothetical protein